MFVALVSCSVCLCYFGLSLRDTLRGLGRWRDVLLHGANSLGVVLMAVDQPQLGMSLVWTVVVAMMLFRLFDQSDRSKTKSR